MFSNKYVNHLQRPKDTKSHWYNLNIFSYFYCLLKLIEVFILTNTCKTIIAKMLFFTWSEAQVCRLLLWESYFGLFSSSRLIRNSAFRKPTILPFLGTFAKLGKGKSSFVMSCFFRMEQLVSRWTYFNQIWYLEFCFSKICRETSSFIKIWQE